VLDFLNRAAARPCCVIQVEGTTKFHPTTCTCLHALRPAEGEQGPSEKLRMVAAAVCNFALLDNKVRRRLEIRHAEEASSYVEHFNGNDGKPYYISLATTAPYEDLAPDSDELAALKLRQQRIRAPFVCLNAYQVIHGIGWHRFKEARKHAQEHTFPVHGLTGKKGDASNRKSLEVQAAEQSLAVFLGELQEEGEVPATRMTRALAGIEMRKEEEGLIELPHYYSIRSLYGRWCKENGWNTTFDSRSRETKEVRTDALWLAEVAAGTEVGPTLSYITFRKFWKEHFPLMKIRAKAEDTCGECLLYAQRFKYRSFKQLQYCTEINAHSEAKEVLKAIVDSKIEFEHTAGTETDESIERADTKLLEGALEHVRAHHKQRAYHNLLQVGLLLVVVVWLLAFYRLITYR